MVRAASLIVFDSPFPPPRSLTGCITTLPSLPRLRPFCTLSPTAQVSAAKGELDEQKGRALEDISAMVDRLHAEIDSKQELLAPVIKELRELRIRGKDIKVRATSPWPGRFYLWGGGSGKSGGACMYRVGAWVHGSVCVCGPMHTCERQARACVSVCA